MRPGMVVSIRVNPKDCQSVLDLMEKIGYKTYGNSFSHLVSMTLASLLETARQQGGLPEPDPFQYLNRVGPFVGGKRSGRKLSVAKAVNELGANFQAPTMPVGQPSPVSQPSAAPGDAPTAEQREAVRRMQELEFKRENAPDTWSSRDEEEYKECERVAFG